MRGDIVRVGVVGLEPDRSWAARAHLPALRASSEFVLSGVANSSFESATRAAEATGIPRAFESVAEMAVSPEIDLIAVTVKVPHHAAVVQTAIAAGKHVYCEWPLGNGLAEAERLTQIAKEKGVLAVVGTQAVLSPEVEELTKLIEDGFIGEVLSTTIVARGGGWGGTIANERTDGYLLDRQFGATMLTIPFGHTVAALIKVLGNIDRVSSVLSTRRTTAMAADTKATLPVTAPDQVLVSGILANGAPVSMHYRGGMPRDGQGFLWEINGTEGDLRLTAPFGHLQLAPLSLTGVNGQEKAFQTLKVNLSEKDRKFENSGQRNVSRVYAAMVKDLRDGSHTAPTFEDGLTIHRVIAAVEDAAQQSRNI